MLFPLHICFYVYLCILFRSCINPDHFVDNVDVVEVTTPCVDDDDVVSTFLCC